MSNPVLLYPIHKKYNIISGCVNECVQQGRNGEKERLGKIIATIKIQCDWKKKKKKKHASVRALHAHVELRCWIIQPAGEDRAFCKNAGASDGEWVRSLIHLSGKHSFFLPPPIWPFLSSSTLAIHLLHSPPETRLLPKCFRYFSTFVYRHHMLIVIRFTSITWSWII